MAVYCTVDDLYRSSPRGPRRPGAPALADSEVLTLLVLAQWQPRRSERAFLRYAGRHWRGLLPAREPERLQPPGARPGAGGLRPGAGGGPGVVAGAAARGRDGVPVPLARRLPGRRRRLFDATEAGFGRGGSDRAAYYGVQLLAAVHPAGVVTGFVVGPPDTSERWLLEAPRAGARPGGGHPTAAELAPVLGPATAGAARVGPTGRLRPRAGAGPRPWGPAWSTWGWRAPPGSDAGGRQRGHGADQGRPARRPARPAPRVAPHRLQPAPGGGDRLRLAAGRLRPRLPPCPDGARPAGPPRAKVAALNLGVAVNRLSGRSPFAFFDPLA